MFLNKLTICYMMKANCLILHVEIKFYSCPNSIEILRCYLYSLPGFIHPSKPCAYCFEPILQFRDSCHGYLVLV
jgi:hypothetical protein